MPWWSLDGTISFARDPEMTLWRRSQGRDEWVLMGIDRVDGGQDFDGWVEYFDRWVLILIGLIFSGSLVGFDDLTVDWVGDDLA